MLLSFIIQENSYTNIISELTIYLKRTCQCTLCIKSCECHISILNKSLSNSQNSFKFPYFNRDIFLRKMFDKERIQMYIY